MFSIKVVHIVQTADYTMPNLQDVILLLEQDLRLKDFSKNFKKFDNAKYATKQCKRNIQSQILKIIKITLTYDNFSPKFP